MTQRRRRQPRAWTHRGTWKRCERQIAAALGGERIPVSGRHNMNTPDVLTPEFAVEVKYRAKVPHWLHQFANSFTSLRTTECHIDIYRFSHLRSTLSQRLRLITGTKVPEPAWIRHALLQARTAARFHRRRPLVVVCEKGKPINSAICMVIYETRN